MSQRNFDNNINNLSDIYNTINNTNLIVATLPTKTDVNTSITNNNLLVNTALTNAINLNNTSNVAYTNSSVNTAISNCNTFSTAYTNTKINTEIARADLALSNAIINNNLLYTPTASIGVGSQFNSISIGSNTKLYNGFSLSIGNNSAASNYSTSLGYNSGLNSNANNVSCTFIGSNSGITSGSNFINSTAIGSGSVINASNQIMMGLAETTTYCASLTAPNITTSNLISNGIVTYNYSSLPLLTSYKVNGFSSSINNVKNIIAFDSVLNCSSITLPCGVFYINYHYNINYSTGPINYWLNFGLGSTASLIDIQANKSYCSSNPSNVYNCANSFCFTSTNGSILHLNVMMNSFDNPTLTVSNLANFTYASKITATRVA